MFDTTTLSTDLLHTLRSRINDELNSRNRYPSAPGEVTCMNGTWYGLSVTTDGEEVRWRVRDGKVVYSYYCEHWEDFQAGAEAASHWYELNAPLLQAEFASDSTIRVTAILALKALGQ
jgi:hypothetical protein